jgi:hypothetical protein
VLQLRSIKNHTKIVFKLYFLKDKPVLTTLLLLFTCANIMAQEKIEVRDSLLIRGDTTDKAGVMRLYTTVSSSAIDMTVVYKSSGYKKNDLVNKKVYLIDKAEVTYGNINLKADSIVLDMENGTVFASGRRDSTGRLSGKAIFMEGTESYEVDSLEYNFKTTRAIITGLGTKQQEGFLHSTLTKKHDDGTLHFQGSSFTTCDADHPHFYIRMPKSKVYPDEKIVSGPAYLVIEDIPLPLILPFGYFPVQKKLASGIIMPKYGQEQQRGYFLSDGGYYFAGTDYFDLKMTGNIYSNGTWLASAESAYNLRYRFSGRFSYSYANNIAGHKGLPDYARSSNYRVSWTHSQDPKASPGSRLSANVNMSSSNYDRNNTYTPIDNVTTQRQSSVSYIKNWTGTPFNLSMSVNHSQNNANKTVSLNLPKANFSMARIYPFKSKRSTGPSRWYQDIQLQYTAALDNQINTYDSLLFTKSVWKNAKAGFKHEVPVSFQIRPFRNMSISPSLRYTGVLFPRKVEKFWIPDYFDPELNETRPVVVTDTMTGFFYGQAINPSISASFSPQIFGMYTFTKPESRWQAVRHVIRPSVSFSYIPFIEGLSTPMYRDVQIDTTGKINTYSIFENSIFETPALSQRSGNLSFNLVNMLEAKVFEKNDTTGKAKNVKLIENLSLSTSYNVFATSMNWSPVSMSFRTVLLDKINIAASGSFTLYGINDSGTVVNSFALKENNKLMRVQNISASVDFDLRRLLGEKKQEPGDEMQGARPIGAGAERPEGGSSAGSDDGGEQRGPGIAGLQFDEYGYAVIDLPWTMAVAYNFNFRKTFLENIITQQFTLNGTLRIAAKTNITYFTGYDIKQREITMTRIGITRDLHCWTMSLNWIPTGYLKSWDFTLRVNSSLLSDIKYERRKDYRENF